MSLDQTGRLIRMAQGPLGPDEVSMTGFSGREAISQLFTFRLEFISTRLDLRPSEIIGKDVTIELDRRDNRGGALEPRYFHGYINRFAAGQVVSKDGGMHKYRHYRAEMVPWLWFLTQTARCYLFFPEKEDKTIYEVIDAVFKRAKSDLHVDPVNDLNGISDLKSRKVKHCVQYRETDFNFVSRTMERYGVYYYFKFENGKHTLVLDMKKNYPKCVEAEVIYPRVTGTQSAEDHITDWQHDYEFVSGKWTHTDYNFEKPSTSLKADAPRLPAMDLAVADKYEIYDYPGDYAEKSEGQGDAKVRQEEKEAPHNTVQGASLCRTFTPGHSFKLTSHPDEDAVSEQGKGYLLTSVEHSASQPTEDTRDRATTIYNNRFTCIPDSVQFRPERTTPVPLVTGVQTAVVVGPSGEEIHTDKYGRVKVQFHWDREGKKDGNSSAWIRVSQVHAGKSFGGIDIPRIGEEVIVDYLEADPDQPIVIGRVYNAEVMPPFGLPGAKVVSGMKSNSTKGGGGYNEFVLDDTKGNELIRVHGQFDMDSTIQNDLREHVLNNRSRDVTNNETISIGVDRTETVGSNESLTVGSNRTESVGSNETLSVGSNRNRTVGGSETVTVALTRTHSVGINEAITIGAAQQVTVGAMQTISVGANQSTSVGKNQSNNIGSNQSTSVGGNQSNSVAKDLSENVAGGRTSSVGKDDSLSVAKKLNITAGDQITLTTGKASITMKKDGTIQISGKDITINGTGQITGKASKDMVLKGKKILQN